jgi:uncharacterized protein
MCLKEQTCLLSDENMKEDEDLIKKSLIMLIDFYKKAISPYLPNACRFTPTCSAYAKEALLKHGAFKGGLLAFYRVLRCNPFNKNRGYDPVP